jgi:Leucine-rich repeat (LRR) protein
MGITYSAPSPLLVAEGIPTSRAYLEALALAHDKFPGMSRDGLSLMALALSRNLRRLVLHEKHLLASLTSVSDDLCLELGKTLVADDGLLELTVHDRNITTVSSHVDQLVFLQRLDLAHCSLTELPKSVGKLGRRADKKAGGFWSVGLADNRLERLPDTIAGWTKVRVLHLSNNRLVELPEDLAAMTCLEILTVDTNRELKSLPEAFRRLKKLKFVDASNTALEELPISFYTLPSLETLVLECTNIEEIEEMVSWLTHGQ